MLIELFNLLTERQLHRIRFQKASNLLLAEKELVFDERLHVSVAVDYSLEKLTKVSALATLAFHVESLRAGEYALLLMVNGHVVVARWQIVLNGHEFINPVSDVHNFLCRVDHIIVTTSSRVDLEISPDHGLLVEQASQNLLHELIFHVKDFANDVNLVAILALVTQSRHLLFERALLITPDLLRLYRQVANSH